MSTSWAQSENKPIVDNEMKIQFIVPEGWQVTKKESSYLMGSDKVQGVMLLKMESFKSLKKLKSAMEAGIEQEDGSLLLPIGALGKLGDQGITGMYGGTIDGTEMTGFLMALMPPSKGRAAICFMVAPKNIFNQSNIDHLKILLRSVIFL